MPSAVTNLHRSQGVGELDEESQLSESDWRICDLDLGAFRSIIYTHLREERQD